MSSFNRYFYAQIGKQGAIVDERFNGGGLLATDIAEILNRRPLSAVSNRVVRSDLVQPQGIFGPKVMIINETAGIWAAMPCPGTSSAPVWANWSAPGPGVVWLAWPALRN